MKPLKVLYVVSVLAMLFTPAAGQVIDTAAAQTYDINTLAGKVASLNGTAGLQIRFSALIEQEAQDASAPTPATPITPSFVLSSPLDGNTVLAPDVTVNQDTAAAPQNETAIVVDPNNPNRLVAGANDYAPRTWSCTINGTPCSALGEAFSGTYFSNDGGHTWCCGNSDPQHLGTLIPGVNHLGGGIYDAGGDPSVAFDSRGNVFYAGLGFDRTAPPNTVAVNRGTFDGSGNLTWSQPVFINPTTAPSTLNDKEWIAADWHVSSPFRDRIYVSWTRFLFNPQNGAFVQAPIFFAYSKDGGVTFSTPTNISGKQLIDQGSRPVVGYDGSVYVFFEGATRVSTLSSTFVVKSTDGGVTFGKPVAVSTLADMISPFNTVFRDDSFPAAAAAPNGDLYAAWSTEVPNDNSTFAGTTGCASFLVGDSPVYKNCHGAAVFSKSTDGGKTWSAPAPIFEALNASNRTAIGYPAGGLSAPSPRHVDTFWPGVAISPSGRVYLSSYGADVVSPWQTCDPNQTPPPPEGRINCLALGPFIHNARLDYFVRDVTTGGIAKVSTHPINSRNGFGGGFIGDYSGLAVGSDNTFHAFWTDTNNKQTVVWFYGLEFVPTVINQEDVVLASGNF